MYNISGKHLAIASRILTARLCRPLSLDAIILERHLIDANAKLDNYCHRFVGCFDQREDGAPCFYLIARSNPDSEVSHVFVYYLNRDYMVIQDTDIEVLRKFIPGLGTRTCEVEVGIIQVKCTLASARHLGALITAIDYSLNSKLLESHIPCRLITYRDDKLFFVGVRVGSELPYCNGELTSDSLSKYKTLVDSYSIPFELLTRGSSIDRSSVGVIRSRGHLINLIYCKEARIANYILAHDNQLESTSHYDELQEIASRWISDEITSHCYTRLISNEGLRCDGAIVLETIDLALEFMPNTLTVLYKEDISYLEARYPGSWQYHDGLRTVAPPRRASHDYVNPSRVSIEEDTLLTFRSGCKRPEVVRSSIDSQATTIITDRADIRAELSFLREVANERKRVRDSIIPPVHKVEPFDDLTQSYLKFLPSFNQAIEFIGQTWNRYAKTVASRRIRTFLDKPVLPEEVRFVIYPVDNIRDSEPCLLIVDHQNYEWIYISADNLDHSNPDIFRDVTNHHLMSSFPELSQYKGRAVPITSVFHKEYIKVHLLMSIYVISRLFEYHVGLPSKIVYAEWEFRKYSSNICVELQLINMEYNLEHNLIDEDGHLKEGAKKSFPSPIMYEPAVVPKDLCMFCKRRGWGNLGRHISCAHGGQAKAANKARLDRR